MTYSHRKFIALGAAAILAGTLATGAVAAVISSSSTELLLVENRSDAANQETTSTAYHTLTGATVPVTLSGGSRLVRVRFTAESSCTGIAEEAWCVVRIVAVRNGNNQVIPLQPNAGGEYAFDSPNTDGNDQWEGHAMERSRRLPAGTYTIKVQWKVSNVGVNFTLDDWHYSVEVFK